MAGAREVVEEAVGDSARGELRLVVAQHRRVVDAGPGGHRRPVGDGRVRAGGLQDGDEPGLPVRDHLAARALRADDESQNPRNEGCSADVPPTGGSDLRRPHLWPPSRRRLVTEHDSGPPWMPTPSPIVRNWLGTTWRSESAGPDTKQRRGDRLLGQLAARRLAGGASDVSTARRGCCRAMPGCTRPWRRCAARRSSSRRRSRSACPWRRR